MTCKVFKEVLIETAANPATPWYICARTAAFPEICGAELLYNSLLQNRAFRELNKNAAELGCEIAIQAGEKLYRIAIIEGKQAASDIDRTWRNEASRLRAYNTSSGIRQLMNYLRSH